MIKFSSEYYVNPDYVKPFESAFSATGAFGSMFVRHGCLSYALFKHNVESGRYLVTHTWENEAAFTRAQERAAQESYSFQNQSSGWINKVDFLTATKVNTAYEKPDGPYELVSKS